MWAPVTLLPVPVKGKNTYYVNTCNMCLLLCTTVDYRPPLLETLPGGPWIIVNWLLQARPIACFWYLFSLTLPGLPFLCFRGHTEVPMESS